MKKPYGVASDIHFHGWSAFSTDQGGINSRLVMLINELLRCGEEILKAGGDTLYITGDLFHVRGWIAPSVLNPVMEAFKKLVKMGLYIHILPGNHDMERRNSEAVSNAVTVLGSISDKIYIWNESHCAGNKVLIPWFENLDEFRTQVDKQRQRIIDAGASVSDYDLMIHAPIDGVIMNLPSHGLTLEYLAGLGFRRVFAGHFHNHKEFDGGVYSVGALAHHTWSDVGTKAGFLIVTDTEVKWFKSHCPDFIEIGMIEDEDDEITAKLRADGNYVKVRTESTKSADINGLKDFFLKAGAKGIVVHHIPKPTAVRVGATPTTKYLSLEETVADFATKTATKNAEAVNRLSQEILAEASIV
jgi:DNA repair exonuclease SbcCD nuclease subunit